MSRFRVTGVTDTSVPYVDLAAGEYRLYFSSDNTSFAVKDSTGAVTYLAGLSPEAVEDLLGNSVFQDTATIDFTYDDALNQMSWSVKNSSITVGMLAFDPATQAELDVVAAALSTHITNPTGAHAATAISNTPAGGVAATTVQAAINELDTEKENVANKATDFSVLNNTKYPTTQAVENRIAAAVTGLWDDRGDYDASTNLFPTSGGSGTAGAVLKGDLWTVSVQGTLGGQTVHIGDTIRAKVDTPGQTASNWSVLENNFGYVAENQANKSNDGTMAANSATLYPTQQAAKTYADAKVINSIAAADTTHAPSRDAVNTALGLKANTASLGTAAGKNVGNTVLDPGTGSLEIAMPPGGLVTGANKTYLSTDRGFFYRRSNAGAAMSDTLPLLANTTADKGFTVTVYNEDTVVAAVLTMNASGGALFRSATGGTSATSPINYGCRQEFIWDGTAWVLHAGNANLLRRSGAIVAGNFPKFVDTAGNAVVDSGFPAAAATATTPGFQSAASFKKQRDQYYDAVNDLGIDPTGSVDATTILTNWHTSLPAAGGAVLFIPTNTRMRVDGPVALSKDNITIEGADRRSSIIGTGSATANQFNVTGDGCTFSNLRFEAGTTAQNLALRTAGYCVEIQAASNGSNILSVDAIGHWSGINLEGCQLPTIDDFNMREYGANATAGALIRVNTNSAGGDTLIRRLQSDNGSNIAGYAGVRVVNTASLIMEACNIIHATEGLAVNTANAGTVPSIKATDCFFDNGTYGLRFNPTGTGVWYRSEFVNCWFGSNSVAGIGFSSAQFEGIEFTNCKILGNPTGVQATSGGGKWTLNGGCVVAGSSTAGIDLSASANHYPVIQGCRIGTSGAFGVNAIGIRVNAGAFKGLVIQANDVTDNTSALSLAAVTISGGTAADYQRFRIIDNAGINPRGTNLAPAVPAAGVSAINTTGFRVQVFAKNGATAPASLIVNGVAAVPSNAVATTGANIVTLEPGGQLGFTTTAAASWQWIGQ